VFYVEEDEGLKEMVRIQSNEGLRHEEVSGWWLGLASATPEMWGKSALKLILKAHICSTCSN
jgi:hypothetical protein